MLFASIVLERYPLLWGNLPDGLNTWVQNVGFVAALGIALVLIARSAHRDLNDFTFWNFSERMRALLPALKVCILASFIGYGLLALVWAGHNLGVPAVRDRLPRTNLAQPYTVGDWLLTLSGALALFVALTPVVIDFATRISWGRIWAIALLSWKEAVRGRVVWVFGFIALIFLFAGWFVTYKPEDQLRSYVRVVYVSMSLLCLILAGLLGAFSIPTDVNNNSIHTIVTKPVEKMEIVLGRFIGYAALLTVGLFFVASLSLIYVLRGVNEEAKLESDRARVPQYGFLQFVGTKDAMRGESVGREWGYRSYITGPTHQRRDAVRQYAVWDLFEVPGYVRARKEDPVFEFSFDIFRLSKGEEDKGVFCSFTFVDVTKLPSLDRTRQSQLLDGLLDEVKKMRNKLATKKEKELEAVAIEFEAKKKGKSDKEQKELESDYDKLVKKEYLDIELQLIAQYHIYQVAGQEVTDFHTQNFKIAPEILQAMIGDNVAGKFADDGSLIPMVRIFVSVDVSNQAQMVGVSPQDFYLLAAERPFWQNYFKGVLGLWCTHMLVLAVALACSTYLSSVISLLMTMFLFIAGMSLDYLKEIAERRVDGGGPFEAAMRLGGKMSPAAPLDASPTTSLVTTVDRFFSWWIGRVLNLIPDVNRHDMYQFVANGFDIGWTDLLLVDNGLALFGYLLPWAVLAYYLMKYREIANPQ